MARESARFKYRKEAYSKQVPFNGFERHFRQGRVALGGDYEETLRKTFFPIRASVRDDGALMREDRSDTGSMYVEYQSLMSAATQNLNQQHAMKCHLAAEVLQNFGTLRLQVMGWSMLPTIWPGDVVVIEKAESSSVSGGDIVLFGRDKRLFVHRVVKKRVEGTTQVLTQGDAMPVSDPALDERELMGKVTLIVRNGRSIRPTTKLGVRDRVVASLARQSETGARVVVGVHGFIHNS